MFFFLRAHKMRPKHHLSMNYGCVGCPCIFVMPYVYGLTMYLQNMYIRCILHVFLRRLRSVVFAIQGYENILCIVYALCVVSVVRAHFLFRFLLPHCIAHVLTFYDIFSLLFISFAFMGASGLFCLQNRSAHALSIRLPFINCCFSWNT